MEPEDYLLIDSDTGTVIAISGNSEFDDLGQTPVMMEGHRHVIAKVLESYEGSE